MASPNPPSAALPDLDGATESESAKAPSGKRKQPISEPPSTTSSASASASETAPPKRSKPSEPTLSLPSPITLTLTHHTGDIFSAPPNTLLIHACNTFGSWGAGIAAAFRTRYPCAYHRYRSHCLSYHNPTIKPVPRGSFLLIPPCETNPRAPKHWIGCLFTSAKYGRAKDAPEMILENTGPSVRGLLAEVKKREREGVEIGGVRMCRINSARFGVEWGRTVAVLEGIRVEEGWREEVEVWSIE